jgi:hypothetical protein
VLADEAGQIGAALPQARQPEFAPLQRIEQLATESPSCTRCSSGALLVAMILT